ncbi:type II secretion system F family protein [Mariniluteicoccus flavus]
MTALAALLAAGAAWAWWPARRSRVPMGRRRRSGGPGLEAAYAGVAFLGVVLVGSVAGSPAGAVGAALAIAGGGLALVVRGRWRTRARDRTADDVARACSALAQELSIGRVPATALSSAADDFAVLRPAASVAAVGGDVVALWEEAAAAPGADGLGRLGRAWRMAERTGAPLADTLESVASRLRDDRQVTVVVNGELAAALMTGRLLTVLPLAGLGIGYGIGGDPLDFLLGNAIGQACLVVGTCLGTGGLLWTEHMGNGRRSQKGGK